VAPLLSSVLNDVQSLEKELAASHKAVEDLELRVDTQILATMRQAGVGGAGNQDLERQRSAVTQARAGRDQVLEDVVAARMRHLKLLFDLKDHLEEGTSTSLTLADMEDANHHQQGVHQSLKAACRTVCEEEVGLSKTILSNFDSTAISGLIPRVPPQRGVAVHAFAGDATSNQLPIKRGEAIQVVDQISDQWFFCVDGQGKSGLVPCSYVETTFGTATPVTDGSDDGATSSAAQEPAQAVNDEDLMYHTPSAALGLVMGATRFLDAMNLDVAEARHESASILLEELRSSRARELKTLWMLAEERRALEAALRCAKPGQFMSIRDRLTDIQRSASMAHARCRLLASVTSPAAARVGCTLQAVKNINDLGGFSATGLEWLKMLFGEFKRLDVQCGRLNDGWEALNANAQWKSRFGGKQGGGSDDELAAVVRAAIDGAKAVASKAQDSVLQEVMQLAAHAGAKEQRETPVLVQITTALQVRHPADHTMSQPFDFIFCLRVSLKTWTDGVRL